VTQEERSKALLCFLCALRFSSFAPSLMTVLSIPCSPAGAGKRKERRVHELSSRLWDIRYPLFRLSRMVTPPLFFCSQGLGFRVFRFRKLVQLPTLFPCSCRVTTGTAAGTSGQFGSELDWTVKQSRRRKLSDDLRNRPSTVSAVLC